MKWRHVSRGYYMSFRWDVWREYGVWFADLYFLGSTSLRRQFITAKEAMRYADTTDQAS